MTTVADPARGVASEPEHDAVVAHLAVFIAGGRIDHLPDAKLIDVAGHAMLHQIRGFRADHRDFAQGRQLRDHHLFAAGPVFAQRAD
ncbi:hypothetical protein GCM10011415_05360 [Salipiger pallidus]|uniref:Uncharacterized protein n=1 Tax=Salipiger pallidus TaxID=1775170 RepID=A0A8J2ZGQ8_9RHOB|nr:hypothetical protein GCM10011415_05360 [Salipiger pallidus]